jgi:hypothetical protein
MPVITVAPRYVARPWEWAACRSGRTVIVGREATVQPDPGVLEEYRTTWPHRTVVWDALEQLWEVRQRNPLTGHDESYEHLFLWDAPPDEQGGLASPDELERRIHLAMIGREDHGLTQTYRPFDYEFVRERRRQRQEWLALRGKQRVSAIVADRNAALRRSKQRDLVREMAAGLNELRRWLPVVAALQDGQRVDVALTEKLPFSAGGLASPASSTSERVA